LWCWWRRRGSSRPWLLLLLKLLLLQGHSQLQIWAVHRSKTWFSVLSHGMLMIKKSPHLLKVSSKHLSKTQCKTYYSKHHLPMSTIEFCSLVDGTAIMICSFVVWWHIALDPFPATSR
jgi:hypothetical protein